MNPETFTEFIGLVGTGLAVAALVLGAWRRRRWPWTFSFALFLVAVNALNYTSNVLEWAGVQITYLDQIEDYLDLVGTAAWFLLFNGCLRDLAAARLQKSEEHYQSLVVGAPIGVVEATVDGRIRYANPATGNALGTAPDRLVNDRLENWLCNDHDRGLLRRQFAATRAGAAREPVTLQTCVCRANGETRRMRLEICPLGDDLPTGFVCFLIDNTDRWEQEEELRRANAELAEALESLERAQHQQVRQERLSAFGQMASGVAHDFNNLLTPIMGYADLLLMGVEDGTTPAKTKRHATAIKRAAADAGTVVSRLRSFYRPADPAALNTVIDVNEVLDEAITMTRPMWQAQAQGGGATFTIERDLTATRPITADVAELRGMITNLICNAVDAMPAGGPIVCRSRDEAENVCIQIEDRGRGMDETTRQRCFEPFFSTKGEHGSGLGLSMVFGGMKRHGGDVQIWSQPGEGTTVTLLFPAAKAPPQRHERPAARPDMDTLSLLLVDDEEMPREAVAALLQANGHRVVAVANGNDALEALDEQTVDVVITDRAMPGMNGDQLAVAIKARQPQTPVILLTGFGGLMAGDGQKPPGVDLVVGKPIDRAGLQQALDRVQARTPAIAG